MQLKDGTPLTARHIKVMTDRMASFDGVGDAKALPRKVQINIWPYESRNHTGHASMIVENKGHNDPRTYISWWQKADAEGVVEKYTDYSYYVKKGTARSINDYKTEAVHLIAPHTKEKLRARDKVSEVKEVHTLNKNFRFVISNKISTMLDAYQKTSEKLRHRPDYPSFQFMTTQKQKELFASFFNEALTESESEELTDKEQKEFAKKIVPRILDIMLDGIFGSSNDMQSVVPGVLRREVNLAEITAQIFADERIKQAKDEAINAVLAKAPYCMPRAREEKNADGNWMVNSEKVYLPLMGQQDKETFALFGLNEQAIQKHWAGIQNKANNNEIGHKFVSKTQNCAGIVAGALAAGGAGNLVPFKSSLIVETPNDIHRYVLAVQSRVDQLNQQSTEIRDFYRREIERPELNQINSQPLSRANVAGLQGSFQAEIKNMTPAEQKRFSVLAKAIKHIPDAAKTLNTNDLTRHSIALVEALSALLDNPVTSLQNLPVERALLSAAGLRESLEMMMKAATRVASVYDNTAIPG